MACVPTSSRAPAWQWRGFFGRLGGVLWRGLQEFCGKKAFREIEPDFPRQDRHTGPPLPGDANSRPLPCGADAGIIAEAIFQSLRQRGVTAERLDQSLVVDSLIMLHTATIGKKIHPVNFNRPESISTSAAMHCGNHGGMFDDDEKKDRVEIGRRLYAARRAFRPELSRAAFVRLIADPRSEDEANRMIDRYRKWEKGEASMSRSFARKFKRFFGVGFEWFYDGDPLGIPEDKRARVLAAMQEPIED